MSATFPPHLQQKLDKLSGKDRAAILMLSLPEKITSEIFKFLELYEIRDVSLAMLRAKQMDIDIIKAVSIMFVSQLSSAKGMIGSTEGVKRLLTKLLPKDQADTILEEVKGTAGRTVWDRLGNVNVESLASYLNNEYPQTIAVILSKIPSSSSAKVLARLEDDLSNDVINRMLDMDAVKKEVIDDIEKNLKLEFMSSLSRTYKQDSYSNIAEIFNAMDRTAETRLMKNLEKTNDAHAKKIKNLMFTFEDLKKMDGQSLQTLIRSVDKNQLAISLKGVDDVIKEQFFACMTERAGKLLHDELEQLGPVRLKAVEEAQMQVISKAKELAEANALFLPNLADAEDSNNKLIE